MITKFDVGDEAYIKVHIQAVTKGDNYERYQCALVDDNNCYRYDNGACYDFYCSVLMTKEEIQKGLEK